jgi:hypothetical protein
MQFNVPLEKTKEGWKHRVLAAQGCKHQSCNDLTIEYLHLCALVLEPELDLERLQAQVPAQLLPLLVIRVRALLEEPAIYPWIQITLED